eukprot:jgi/Botrbrau1/9100/Bobra.0305s0007.1
MAAEKQPNRIFHVGQQVRVEPGRYLVVASSRPVQDNIYADVKVYAKGKVHGDRQDPDKDPRELLFGRWCYRVWAQDEAVSNATILLVPDTRLSKFYECAHCGRYADDACAGCEEVYYCDHTCQEADWKAGHAAICRKQQLDSHLLGDTALFDRDPGDTKQKRRTGFMCCFGVTRTLSKTTMASKT